VVADSVATLAFLVQQGVITLHPWTSRDPELEHPDLVVFDLDPGDEEGFEGVRGAAQDLRALLGELGMTPFVMLTGSDGAHVRVPVRRGPSFDDVRTFARQVTEILARRSPERYTTAVRKEKREGRLFLDVARNALGQTAVAPYSLRARPGAPVAAPLEWDELGTVEGPRRWTLASVPRRLAQRSDPWKGMGRHAVSLEGAVEALSTCSE
jgi:bifunctional non-homologous end joining protein LigD